MRRFFILFFLSVLFLNLPAQKILRRALHYVSTDSIAFLTADKTNFFVAASAADSTALQRYRQISRSEARKLLRDTSHSTDERFPKTLSPQFYPFFEAAHRIDYIAATLPWTANGILADIAESLLYNEILMGMQRGAVMHYSAEAMLQGALMTYMTDKEGIYVNLYQNCIARIVQDGLCFTLDQITDMPYSPGVKLRVSGIVPQTRMKLRLRIPRWQENPSALYVNGHETEVEMVNGYAVIDRMWKSGDEVYTDFDLTPHLTPDMLITAGPLKFIPDNIPSEPITIGNSFTQQGHPIVEGKDFKALPMMDM